MIRMLTFAVVLAIVTYVLHRRLVVATRLSGTARHGADLVLVLFWAAAVIGIGSGEVLNPSWARYVAYPGLTWLAALLYLSLGAIVLALGALVVRIAGRLSRRDTSRARATFLRRSTAVLVLGTVAAVAYGVVEAATPRVTRTTVELSALPPSFDGMRVGLVSDLHVGPARGRAFVQSVVDSLMAEKPDLIIVAGDLVDGTVDLVGPSLEPLSQLSAPQGVVVTSGNHEFYAGDGGAWLDLYDSLGLTVLRNETLSLDRGVDSIDLVGIEDLTAPEPYEPDLASALEGTDPDDFQLLVAHQPKQAVEASELGVDMQVSGHTHGGQIWPIVYLVPLQQPSVEGLDTVGRTTLFTTRGAGAWGPPVRIGAPPEISVLELRTAR
ncbi:metallophosphoesterase [Rhodococcus sp. Leaf7]|uniref:metallophosphoesterase n=1 Tax=unclassified Rhodococcus (in: high G+C Gram-positive bacteria) TaxID=192944 RepID=UPI0007016A2B|nr:MULTISPECIES: metallophosphoesterase [unclassified Rhodococcus (in: high G+C Gram-positive bacteria)]KQU03136.1 metallophosphoesterase [Rhodococcus sp. Leaf7]KQU38937.1 metallophosphoesterase [Rhodococcus sp. Leaf247]